MAGKAINLNRYWRAAIEFGWMVSGRVLALIASLVYIRLTAQYLGKADYGLLAVIVGIANGLFVLLGSPLGVPLIRIINENADSAAGVYRLIMRYFVIILGVSTLLLILIATAISRFGSSVQVPTGTLLAILLFVMLYVLYTIINAVFTAWRARGLVTGGQFSLACLRLLFTLPLIWFAAPDAHSVFIVSALAFLPIIAVQAWLLVRRQPVVLDRMASFPAELVERFWTLVRQNAPQVWINSSIFFIDKPLFALVLPLEQVAAYTIMQQIARAISSVFIEMGIQFLMPYAFHGATRGSRLQFVASVGLIASCSLIGVAVYVVGSQLLALVASQKYAGLDPLLLAATTFGVCLSFAVNALELKGFADFDIGQYIIGHLFQASVFLGGGLVAAMQFGLTGIVISLFLGAIVRATIVVILNRENRARQ